MVCCGVLPIQRSKNPTRDAAEIRDLAKRARRLALTLSDPHDEERLTRYAQELEQQAREMEAKAAGRPVPPSQPVMHQQQQVQQQSDASKDDDGEPKT